MSEEGTTVEAKDEVVAAVTPQIDVAAIAREAATAAVAEANTRHQQDLNSALSQQRQELANAISGKQDSSKRTEEIVTAMLTNPEQVFKAHQDITIERAEQVLEEKLVNKIAAKIAEQGQAQNNAASEISEAIGDRSDITGNQANLAVLRAISREVDQNASIKDQFKEAVRRYDLFCEANHLGDSKKRIAEASSAIKTTAASQNIEKTPTMEESFTSELEEIRASERAKRNWN